MVGSALGARDGVWRGRDGVEGGGWLVGGWWWWWLVGGGGGGGEVCIDGGLRWGRD